MYQIFRLFANWFIFFLYFIHMIPGLDSDVGSCHCCHWCYSKAQKVGTLGSGYKLQSSKYKKMTIFRFYIIRKEWLFGSLQSYGQVPQFDIIRKESLGFLAFWILTVIGLGPSIIGHCTWQIQWNSFYWWSFPQIPVGCMFNKLWCKLIVFFVNYFLVQLAYLESLLKGEGKQSPKWWGEALRDHENKYVAGYLQKYVTLNSWDSCLCQLAFAVGDVGLLYIEGQ